MSIHRWSPSWSGKPSESNDDFVIFKHYHSFTLRSDFFFVNFQAAKREIDLNVLLCLWSPWWLSFNICRLEATQLKFTFSGNSINRCQLGMFIWHKFSNFTFSFDEVLKGNWFCFCCLLKCWAMRSCAGYTALRAKRMTAGGGRSENLGGEYVVIWWA